MLGLTIHYRGSGQTISTTETARHEYTGLGAPNELLRASEIARSLRASALPKMVHLESVRFVNLPGGSAPEIVLRVQATSAAGRLFTLSGLLLDPLQIDQGVYIELRGRCGQPLGARGTGDLGTRDKVGTLGASSC